MFTRRVIGLVAAPAGMMWLVASIRSEMAWQYQLEPLEDAAYRADVGFIRRWINEHRDIDQDPRFGEAMVGVAAKASATGPELPPKSEAQIAAVIWAILKSREDVNDEICHRIFTAQVEADHAPVVDHLITKGIDVNCHDGGGATPLQRAAEQGNIEMVKRLLEHGANPSLSARWPSGWTRSPIRLAQDTMRLWPGEEGWLQRRDRYEQVIKLLKRYGARE